MATGKKDDQRSEFSLFDDGPRDPAYRRGFRTSPFHDINLSADAPAAAAREELEKWFARIPGTKQADLRARFRSDDRQHSSALLELLTHELLRRLCSGVTIDPNIGGKTPDFLTSYCGTDFVAECTVAQESDKEFGALKRERDVLDIVESISAGAYGLFLEPQRTGTPTVPRRLLTAFLEQELAALGANAPTRYDSVGTLLPDIIEWDWEDWSLHFRPVVVGNSPRNRTIVGRRKGPFLVRDAKVIGRALETKAEAYPHLRLPYLVVATQREGIGNEDDLFEALLGKEEWYVPQGGGDLTAIRGHALNGFLGSADSPRNQHVSGVLYKRNLRSVWAIQNQWTQYDLNRSLAYKESDWVLVHHPAATYPLPFGIFPFATEFVWKSGSTEPILAKSTVNEVLGLPDSWPE